MLCSFLIQHDIPIITVTAPESFADDIDDLDDEFVSIFRVPFAQSTGWLTLSSLFWGAGNVLHRYRGIR